MNSNEIEVEINNLCPMIAMISAGKTSILKVLFDIDYLESSADIGTKFVTIIRYNSECSKEKFYHLKLKRDNNDNYTYFIDDNEGVIEGKEKIKKKIEKLNKELKDNDRPYDQLFYFLEIGTSNFIEDKEYLKNYDLVDIPGVSEYRVQEKTPGETPGEKPGETPSPMEKPDLKKPNEFSIFEELGNLDAPNPFNNAKTPCTTPKGDKTVEEEMKEYNPLEEKNYLTEIFKIIKNKMNNGIFVFNVENYQLTENYRIIGKLQKVINKPIENFLLILNKIDKSENREYDINTLGCKIIEHFPNAEIFNITKNVIAPCSSYQLENELKMSKNFKNLLYYNYLNFLMNNSKNFYNGLTPVNTTNFMDYLKRLIKNMSKVITKKEFYDKIKNIANNRKALKEIKESIQIIRKNHSDNNANLEIRSDDFEEKEIDDIEKEIEEKEKENDNEDDDDDDEDDDEKEKKEKNVIKEEYIDINEQKNNVIILYYYSLFSNKENIPPLSKDTREIIDYFTMKNMNKFKINNNNEKEIINEIKTKIKEERNFNNIIDDFAQRLKHIYISYQKEKENNHINNIEIYINSSIGILKTSKNLYIPLLGVSNAGKSTILNSLIGHKILPSQRNECTKKGILIKHWDKDFAIIRKTKFIKETMCTGNDIYYFSSQENIIAKGEKNIRKILEGANGKFTSNEEDFFYEINIKMKFIDELRIDANLKEKICFIDLPGFGTNNAFEDNDTYSHLILSCNIFLFVVFNLKILENDNHQMLYNLYSKISKKRKIPQQAFIKKCLFIINYDKSQKITSDSESRAKKDILNVIDLKQNNINDELNVCFLNAKFYEDYNFKKIYYNSTDFLFDYEYNGYLESKENFWKGKTDIIKGKTFPKYLLERLKENTRNDINEKFDEKKENICSDDSIKEFLNNNKYFNQNKEKKNKKDLEKIEKYLSFGKNNISSSHLLKSSNIEKFTENLIYYIDISNKVEEKEINENLSRIFDNLDLVFKINSDSKFGKFSNAPIFDNIKNDAEIDLNNFKIEIKKIKNNMKNLYSEYDIKKLFKDCLEEIESALKNLKSNIEDKLKKGYWKDIQNEFEQVFKEKTNNFKDKLLTSLEQLSKNIKDNYDNFYKLINKLLLGPIKPQPDFILTNYISKKLGRENNIAQSIDDIIFEIINQSKECTTWANSKDIWSWINTKIYNQEYLNEIINFMINRSCLKIQEISEYYINIINNFKMEIENEINFKKDYVIDELELKKIDKEKEIQMHKEEKTKKWEEEKKLHEKKKEEWEKLCKEYRELRDDLTKLRLG